MMFPEYTLKASRACTNIEFMWWGKRFVVPYFIIQETFAAL